MVDIFIVDGQSIEDVELQLVKCRDSLRGYARTHIQTALSVIRYLFLACYPPMMNDGSYRYTVVIEAILPASAAKWKK